MSAQFTNSIQLLVSNTASDLTSSSKSYNNFEDTDAFSAALDNATKSYADKSENKTNVQKQDYAKDTKDVPNSSKSDNTNKTDTDDSKQEIKDSEKSQTEENQTTGVDDKTPQQTESSTRQEEAQTSQTDTTQQNTAVLLMENPAQNTIVNEQILSNIEQVQTSAETQSTQTSTTVGTDTVAAATADIEIDTKTLQAVQDIAQEATQATAEEKLKLTNSAQQTPETDAVALTPADTEADNAPVIKVTQEVAANTKENSLANAMENKDTTSTIKDKAVAQMTQLEDTNTVVTQSSTTDSSSQQQQNGTLNGNNAQEQIMKMSVEANSDVSTGTLTGTETFAGKLDSQLSAAKTSSSVLQNQLNQNSILEQVNKQFEQLQQTGNNKVSIVLQPENLGRVSVEIMNSKDGITAKMLTDNQQVKDLFDKNIEALKSNLSSQGVNVNNIKVECTQESANNAMNFEREFSQSFDNPNNSSNHNQTNQSNAQSSYTADSSGFEEGEIEMNGGVEIKNTQTIIQHNGKVDYEV